MNYSPSERAYRNIPRVYNAVNRERWIQQWTNGLPTQYLVNHYIHHLHRSILLKWNSDKKICETYIGMSLWNGITCNGSDLYDQNVSNVLLLDEHGEWNVATICSRCIDLLFCNIRFIT
jgi:hypothetical protein